VVAKYQLFCGNYFMENHYKVHGKARLPVVYLWEASRRETLIFNLIALLT